MSPASLAPLSGCLTRECFALALLPYLASSYPSSTRPSSHSYTRVTPHPTLWMPLSASCLRIITHPVMPYTPVAIFRASHKWLPSSRVLSQYFSPAFHSHVLIQSSSPLRHSIISPFHRVDGARSWTPACALAFFGDALRLLSSTLVHLGASSQMSAPNFLRGKPPRIVEAHALLMFERSAPLLSGGTGSAFMWHFCAVT